MTTFDTESSPGVILFVQTVVKGPQLQECTPCQVAELFLSTVVMAMVVKSTCVKECISCHMNSMYILAVVTDDATVTLSKTKLKQEYTFSTERKRAPERARPSARERSF